MGGFGRSVDSRGRCTGRLAKLDGFSQAHIRGRETVSERNRPPSRGIWRPLASSDRRSRESVTFECRERSRTSISRFRRRMLDPPVIPTYLPPPWRDITVRSDRPEAVRQTEWEKAGGCLRQMVITDSGATRRAKASSAGTTPNLLRSSTPPLTNRCTASLRWRRDYSPHRYRQATPRTSNSRICRICRLS